jgi:anti-sigma regulatory factor (Ser/Thr protein kinase)
VSPSDGHPSHTRELALRLPAEPLQIPVARRAVAEFCSEGGIPAQLIDDVKLVVTEVVTNVVLHAYDDGSTEDRAFDLHAHLEPGELLVSVSDQGRGIGAPTVNPGLGFGLRLALQLTGGMQTGATAAKGGTRLKLRFALPV